MDAGTFTSHVKRLCRYGSASVNTDQPTTDILNSTNVRRKRIWSYWNWKWTLEELAFAVMIGTTKYTVAAKSGNKIDRIVSIIPRDLNATPPVIGAPLDQLTIDDFYRWAAANPTDAPDIPSKYCNLGQDKNFAWTIDIAPSPSANFTMSGYGKKLLTTLALTDIQNSTTFDYFPDGVVEGVLLDGVMSDVYRIQGDSAEADRLDTVFENKLEMLKSEQDNAGRDDSPVTTPSPDSMRYKYRQRSTKGTGVY